VWDIGQPVIRSASTLRNQLVSGFQLTLFWSTISKFVDF
jgi:hypothetical protein